MKKNNLILGTFLVITAIFFSGCGASSSSDSTSTEKVEDSTSTEKVEDSTLTEKVEDSTDSTESGGVVTIGTQVWTSKNLDVSTYRNGDVIPQVQDANAWLILRTGAWCYYDNDASNNTKYGKLYNWYAVNDPRGLAPKGFHIPSNAEWFILTDYLGGAAYTKMKSSTGWDSNGNGTISSGFAGFPGGVRWSNGTFINIGSYGSWWSATECNTIISVKAYACMLASGGIDVYCYGDSKQTALSVRCLAD